MTKGAIRFVCDHCGVADGTVENYRQNTEYVNEPSNWVTLCAPCRKQNDEYWDAMWAEYYNGRL